MRNIIRRMIFEALGQMEIWREESTPIGIDLTDLDAAEKNLEDEHKYRTDALSAMEKMVSVPADPDPKINTLKKNAEREEIKKAQLILKKNKETRDKIAQVKTNIQKSQQKPQQNQQTSQSITGDVSGNLEL